MRRTTIRSVGWFKGFKWSCTFEVCLTESCVDSVDCSDGNAGFLLREALPVARVQGSQPDRLSLTSDTGSLSIFYMFVFLFMHYFSFCLVFNRFAGFFFFGNLYCISWELHLFYVFLYYRSILNLIFFISYFYLLYFYSMFFVLSLIPVKTFSWVRAIHK